MASKLSSNSVRDLVVLANAGAVPQGHTPLSVAKLLARETAEKSGVALVELSAPSIDLFAEAPAEKREDDALPDVPTWIELIPAPLPGADPGHVETRDWRAGFIVDPQRIVDEFNAQPETRRAKPVDWEHKGHRNWRSERNPAAAWIEELKVGDDGQSVWGRVDWTPEGRDDVKYKRYRYISPVVAILWPADSEGHIDWDATPTAVALIDAALTNNPATYIRDLARTPAGDSDEMENSTEATALAASVASVRGPIGGRAEDDEMKLSKEALSRLGLGENATAEQIDAALLSLSPVSTEPHAATTESTRPAEPATISVETLTQAVRDALAPDLAELRQDVDALKGKDTEKDNRLAEAELNSEINSAIATFKATPAMRESLFKLGKAAGVEALREHIGSLPSLAHLSQEVGKGQVGTTPGRAQLSKFELRVCEDLQVDPTEFAETRAKLLSEADAS